jgi:hypothetical protein
MNFFHQLSYESFSFFKLHPNDSFHSRTADSFSVSLRENNLIVYFEMNQKSQILILNLQNWWKHKRTILVEDSRNHFVIFLWIFVDLQYWHNVGSTCNFFWLLVGFHWKKSAICTRTIPQCAQVLIAFLIISTWIHKYVK